MYLSTDNLDAALKSDCDLGNIHLTHRDMGELSLPTGRLVACDPFVCMDTDPFSLPLTKGSVPLTLSIAEIGTDQRVAFAILRITESTPVRWEMMTTPGQDLSKLKEDEMFGYGVDSGTGCFADSTTISLLNKKMGEDADYFEVLNSEMEKTYRPTWSWLNVNLGEANLIAFSSGYGDGFYATYAGFDSEQQLSRLVTDFEVISAKEKPATGLGVEASPRKGYWQRFFQ
jgi:hypothetical protein